MSTMLRPQECRMYKRILNKIFRNRIRVKIKMYMDYIIVKFKLGMNETTYLKEFLGGLKI